MTCTITWSYPLNERICYLVLIVAFNVNNEINTFIVLVKSTVLSRNVQTSMHSKWMGYKYIRFNNKFDFLTVYVDNSLYIFVGFIWQFNAVPFQDLITCINHKDSREWDYLFLLNEINIGDFAPIGHYSLSLISRFDLNPKIIFVLYNLKNVYWYKLTTYDWNRIDFNSSKQDWW